MLNHEKGLYLVRRKEKKGGPYKEKTKEGHHQQASIAIPGGKAGLREDWDNLNAGRGGHKGVVDVKKTTSRDGKERFGN